MMSRTARSFARISSAVLLVLFAAASQPQDAAHAATSCRAAPTTAPPQGSHWYYRVDRASGRKCWYLGAKGQKTRQAAPQANLPTPRVASPDNATDRQVPPRESGEQTSANAAMTAFARQRNDPGPRAQVAIPEIPAWVQWSEPPTIAATTLVDSSIRSAAVAADHRDREPRNEASQQSAAPAPVVPAAQPAQPPTITNPESARRIAILFAVAGAVVGGFLVTMIVSIAIARRRRSRVEPGFIRRYFDRADAFDGPQVPEPAARNVLRPHHLSRAAHDDVARPPQIGRPLQSRAA
jgi:hypothetical protein